MPPRNRQRPRKGSVTGELQAGISTSTQPDLLAVGGRPMIRLTLFTLLYVTPFVADAFFLARLSRVGEGVRRWQASPSSSPLPAAAFKTEEERWRLGTLVRAAQEEGGGDGNDGEEGEGGGQQAGARPSDILGEIFKGARQRRAENGPGGATSGGGRGWNSNNGEGEVDWARYTDTIRTGCVLLANPAVFLKSSRPDLAQRFFLPTEMPPLGGANIDNVANLLPVVILLTNDKNGTTGLVLNRRTGYLVGDLAMDSAGFKIQPVHLGGTSSSQGMFMLHPYPELTGSQQVTDDGLHFGGDYEEAQGLVKDGAATSFRFKFFVQQTQWEPGQLKKEIDDGVWFPAAVGREVLLKNRGREGLKMAKPLWTEVMELMGGSFKDIKEGLYDGDY